MTVRPSNEGEAKGKKGQGVSGFSRLSKNQKLSWLTQVILNNASDEKEFTTFWHSNPDIQKIFDEFSENTLTNFYLPFSVAPNFLIDQKLYVIPMVIEESSVVAAASKAAKFWLDRGGFHTEILGTTKVGTIYLSSKAPSKILFKTFEDDRDKLMAHVHELTTNMNKRGGGIEGMDLTAISDEDGLYRLMVHFETCDAMGANFINSVLEALSDFIQANWKEKLKDDTLEAIMSILSNYTPQCLVRAWVSCPVTELGEFPGGMNGEQFAQKFFKAVEIAQRDPYRATTHNKGIMNGIDAVVIATGNDFRAVEACAHTYASRNGAYQSLSKCILKDGQFTFELTIPLALGTVGGLTSLHPLSKLALKILGTPNSKELMKICAVVGLAQNFGALKSLVTTGIQLGHMKMHLLNILRTFNAEESETEKAKEHFKNHKVSFSAVREFLNQLRDYH